MLNKKFRAAQKVIDREVSLVVSATNDLTSSLGSVPVKVGEITGFLDGVVQKLQSLKRKVNIITCIYIYLFLIYNIPRQFVNLCFIIVINDYFLVFLSCKTTSKQQQLKMHMYVCTFYIIQGEHLILHEKV